MNIHIKTATVTVEGREVPLTRSMVNQLEFFQPTKWTLEQVSCIGTVSLPDNTFYLMVTPDGLQKTTSMHTDVKRICDGVTVPRLILIK